MEKKAPINQSINQWVLLFGIQIEDDHVYIYEKEYIKLGKLFNLHVNFSCSAHLCPCTYKGLVQSLSYPITRTSSPLFNCESMIGLVSIE